MTRPPVRWADTDLPEELSRLIASAAPSQHDNAALSRMRERLHASLGPTFETGLSSASAASHAPSVLYRAKWLCAAAIATAGLSFLAVQSVQRGSSRPAKLPPAASSVALPVAPPPGEPVEQATSALALDAREAPALRAARAPAHGRTRPEQATAKAEKRVAASGERTASRLAAESPGVMRAAHKADRERAAPSGDGAPPSGLAAELRGLAEIRQLLQSSPARALTLAEAQELHFAHGALGPERELLYIEALIRAGRVGEAKHRASRALSASNHPPYRERIENLFAQTNDLPRMGSLRE